MNRLLKTSFNSGTSKQKSNVAAQSVFHGDSTVIILLSPPSALPNIPHMRRSNKLPNQQQQLAARSYLRGGRGVLTCKSLETRIPCPKQAQEWHSAQPETAVESMGHVGLS